MKSESVRAQNSVPADLHDGIILLLQAFEYAALTGRDKWDFAVELPCLRRAGFTNNDLRWLFFAGHVEHGREVSLPGDSRAFHRGGNLVISRKTCLVLTDAGAAFAREMFGNLASVLPPSVIQISPSMASEYNEKQPHAVLPTWDRDRQELRWRGELVKQYKLPSPNQQAILTAFEEEGWPVRIDDPLTPHPEIDAKRRLNDTIKSLNRHQRRQRIHFMGDGSGSGVRWEPGVQRRETDAKVAKASS